MSIFDVRSPLLALVCLLAIALIVSGAPTVALCEDTTCAKCASPTDYTADSCYNVESANKSYKFDCSGVQVEGTSSDNKFKLYSVPKLNCTAWDTKTEQSSDKSESCFAVGKVSLKINCLEPASNDLRIKLLTIMLPCVLVLSGLATIIGYCYFCFDHKREGDSAIHKSTRVLTKEQEQVLLEA